MTLPFYVGLTLTVAGLLDVAAGFFLVAKRIPDPDRRRAVLTPFILTAGSLFALGIGFLAGSLA